MPKKSKNIAKVEQDLPILVNLRVAGSDKSAKVGNIITFLRGLVIEPEKVKSRATFEITFGDKTFRKILNVSQFRRLLVNDISRQIYAKQFNNALNIPVENL